MTELGFYFCENCGTVSEEDVKYYDKKDSCQKCGFDRWIWEPMPEGE